MTPAKIIPSGEEILKSKKSYAIVGASVVPMVKQIGVDTIWFPPNCFDEKAVEKAKELQLNFVSNVCLIGVLRKINAPV